MFPKKIRLLIEYDGTNYQGWQIQRQGLTLQGLIEDRIFKVTGERTRLIGAGRTDAGVHALGQVAAFMTGSYLEAKVLQRALNAMLPEDVRVLDAAVVDEAFHPRYSAVSKSYFYLIANTDISSVFLHRYTWRVKYPLDIDSMRKAGRLLVGRHDFSSFRGAGCGAKNTFREIFFLDIERLGSMDFMTARIEGNFMKVRIAANAFLRHMVRNIVGTIVEAGRGRMSPHAVAEILELKDRRLSGPTAPAKGLFLERIIYP